MENPSSWVGTGNTAKIELKRLPVRISFTPTTATILLVSLFLCISTALINIGIIALDDYEFGIERAIPAQEITYDYIISERKIRSPIPTLILAGCAKVALKLGFLDPANQLRFTLLLVGLFALSIQAYFGSAHFAEDITPQPSKAPFNRQNLCFLLIGTYFVAPLFNTRPLIENLSSPFLTMSAYFACTYFLRGSIQSLALSVFSLMISAMLRFQTGVCVFALIFLVIYRRNIKEMLFFILFSALAFGFSGTLDWLLTSQFHGSLKAYVLYNLEFSSVYGVQPFYVFILLFIALSLPPTLLSKYSGFSWKREYQFIFPTFLYFSVFLLAHTLVPHKEERFMVPVLSIFLILITPLLCFHMKNGWKNWRVLCFFGMNFFLLPLASYNIAQNNTIGLVRFVHHHPIIKTVIGVDDSLLLFPKAFSLNKVKHLTLSSKKIESLKGMGCQQVIAVRKDLISRVSQLGNYYYKIAEFKPGFLEDILVKANPTRNYRREAIALYGDKHCIY